MVENTKQFINSVWNNPFARNSLVLFVGTMIANVINYVFHVVLGRIVSIEVYGEIEALLSLVHVISVPALALTMIVTKYSAHTKADNNPAGSRKIFKVMYRKMIKPSLLFLVLGLLAVPFLRDFLKISSNLPVFFVWISLLVVFFSSINSGILTGWQKFGPNSVVGIIGAIVKLIVAILLVKIGFGLNGVIGSYLLSVLATYAGTFFILKFIFVGKKKDEDDNSIDFAEMKKYVLPAFIAILSITILGNIDMVIAKNKLDELDGGYYGALTIMSKAIFFATSVIASVMFSMSSEESHKKTKSKNTFKYATLLTFLATMCAILIYSLFPRFVISVFFGEKYFVVANFLGWFALMASLYAFVNLFIQYLISVGKTNSVWIFLAITILGTGAMFFWGNTIRDIILIGIFNQTVLILASLLYIFERKGSKLKTKT